MTRRWQIQEANNKLSEVVEAAVSDGPQVITKRGVETAVVLSYEDYRTLTLTRQTMSEFFRTSPLVGIELDLSRDSGPARDEPVS